MMERTLGPDHPSTILTIVELGANYLDAGRIEEALPLLEEAYCASKKSLTHAWVGDSVLAGYVKAEKSEQAVVLASELLSDARSTLHENSAKLSDKLLGLGKSLLKVKAFDKAEGYFRESLAIREKLMPGDWRTCAAKLKLGEALLGQQKYEEAEPLLQEVYDQLKKREKEIPDPVSFASSLIESIDRIVQLYDSANKPDDVKKWQAVRAEYPDVTPPASETP